MLDDPAFRFHHIGVACRDLARETHGWLALGYRPDGEPFIDPLQQVEGRFLIGPGPRLELLAATSDASPVAGYLDRGTKLYHQGFEVADLAAAIERIGAAGARVTLPPTPAVAFGGRHIAFLITPTLNLIELIEAAA